jgi:hypothetical protein
VESKKKEMRINKNIILVLASCMVAHLAFAQDKDSLAQLDEVDIVKAYEPILINSNKIPFGPNLPNIVKTKPDPQTYSYADVKGKVDHRPEDIRPIKATTEKPEKNQFFYAKLGFGYPLIPLVQLIITNPVQTKYRAGLDADFILTKSNKIRNQQYMNLGVKGFGEVFIKKAASVGADIYYRMDQHYFYGYSDVFTSTRDSMKTTYNRFGATLKLRGIKEAPVNYNAEVGFNSTTNKNTFHKPKEFTVTAKLAADYTFKQNYTFGAKFLMSNVSYKDNDTSFVGNQNHFSLQVIPFAKVKFKIWQLMLGPNLIITNKSFYVLPEIVNQLQIYKDYLVLYNEWKTQIKVNSMNNLSVENPFVVTANFTNSVDETRTFVGLRGSIKGFGYDFNFSQLVSRNDAQFFQHTFDTTPAFVNSVFDVQNWDVKAWNPHVSLSYTKGNQFGVKGWFDYFIYYKNSDAELSYRPNIKGGISAFYNWDNRLYVNMDITGQNKSNAVQYNHTLLSDQYFVLQVPELFDMNLSVNYFFTKNIGVFVDMNNLAFQKWQRYYKYQTYGFQVIAGVKLSF